MKRKLEDVGKKLESLDDLLRNNLVTYFHFSDVVNVDCLINIFCFSLVAEPDVNGTSSNCTSNSVRRLCYQPQSPRPSSDQHSFHWDRNLHFGSESAASNVSTAWSLLSIITNYWLTIRSSVQHSKLHWLYYSIFCWILCVAKKGIFLFEWEKLIKNIYYFFLLMLLNLAKSWKSDECLWRLDLKVET